MFSESEKRILTFIYKKSIDYIEEVSFSNGAILASLPTRRYNYVYPRDTALVIRALLKIGKYDQVKRTLKFFIKNQTELGEWAQRYTREGKVASYKPPQLDSNGLILWCFWRYYQRTGDRELLKKAWDKIVKGVMFIEEHYIPEEKILFSINSIHEWPPIESGYDIWVNYSCYSGIKAASNIALILNHKEYYKKWDTFSENLLKGIHKHLIHDKKFRKLKNHIEINDADVSCFAPYILEEISPKNIIMRNTVNFIQKELGDSHLGGISRYLKKHGQPGRNNGGYGPYSMYTGWLAQYYVDIDDTMQAKKAINWFIEYNKEGYIPEHVSTKKEFLEWAKEAKEAGRFYTVGRKEEAHNVIHSRDYLDRGLSYWVTPLTWSHAEFIILFKKLEEKSLI